MVSFQVVTISLDEELELTCKGYFEKGIPETLYPVDDANPGSDDSFELESITIESGSITELLLWAENVAQMGNLSFLDTITELCIDKIND